MKCVSNTIRKTAFALFILGTILCQTLNNNSQPSEKFYSLHERAVTLEIKENPRAENTLLLSSEANNATKLLITEGSSSTEGYGVTNEYPRQLAVLFGGNYYKQSVNLIFDSSNLWTVRNVGNSADDMARMTAQYATQVLPFYNSSFNVNYLTLQGGSNDIAGGRSAAALGADVKAYVAKAKGHGFLVGVCTVFHRVGNDVGRVNDYNNWLRAGNSGADFIIDLAAHPALSDATNLKYFQGDGIHPNSAGQTVIANIFAKAIPQTPVATSVPVTLHGRVMTANGKRGIPNIVLTLTDAAGNTKMARTNSLGFYRFTKLAAGENYTITAKSKLYTFAQQSKVFSTNENLAEVNFIANP